MKWIVSLALVTLLPVGATMAFAPQCSQHFAIHRRTRNQPAASLVNNNHNQEPGWLAAPHLLSSSKSSTPCDAPSDNDVVNVSTLVGRPDAAKILRSAVLTNVDGETIQLGDFMGDETSIVVFLRHLG